MPPSHPPLPPIPQPSRPIFDPFKSSSTGHQQAPNRLAGSAGWRDSRTHKLTYQLRDPTGRGGALHLSDLVGAGSTNFRPDGRKQNGAWEENAPAMRENGWRDIREMMQGQRKRSVRGEQSVGKRVGLEREDATSPATGEGLHDWEGMPSTTQTLISTAKFNLNLERAGDTPTAAPVAPGPQEPDDLGPSKSRSQPAAPPRVFAGLTLYLNGSTLPHVSDHKFKRLLTQHGANLSLTLRRRTVTHVILGDQGALAAGKLQKEITRTGGKGVKFVGVRWVLDSIDKGKRQPESRYEVVRGAMKGQRSVLGMGITWPENGCNDMSNDDT